jgi:hypothetical protein
VMGKFLPNRAEDAICKLLFEHLPFAVHPPCNK